MAVDLFSPVANPLLADWTCLPKDDIDGPSEIGWTWRAASGRL